MKLKPGERFRITDPDLDLEHAENEEELFEKVAEVLKAWDHDIEAADLVIEVVRCVSLTSTTTYTLEEIS